MARGRRVRSVGMSLVIAVVMMVPVAGAQSERASTASVASVAPSAALVEVVASAVADGASLAVDAVRVVGRVAYVTVRTVATGAVATFEIAAHVVVRAGVAVGDALSVVATAGGWLLVAAGEALAFVPDPAVRAHVRDRRLS